MDKTSSYATDIIGTDKISKLIFKFSIPAIIGMLVNALYNVVDRIYIGHLDPLGIGAITLCMPVMLAIMGSSILIGVGANALFSIRLGERRRRQVEKIMGHAFVLLFLIPAIAISISLIFIDEILIDILGATPELFAYAKTYLRIILWGGIFFAMGPGINHFIRSDGHPRTSMLTQVFGALINTILDPILIFGFDMGIAGAAWATIISQFVSFVWVMFYFNSHWTRLRFRFRYMKLDIKLCLTIMAIGFAPFSMQIAMSLVNAVLNKTLVIYGGNLAVTSMGIVFSVLILLFMPMMGLNQGAQPIIGYNYGAKQYERVKKTYKLTVLYATIFFVLGFILIEAFPHLFIYIFHNKADDLMDLSILSLRISACLLPLVGFQMITANFFQAVGKPIQGTLLSLSRQFLFFIPMVICFPAWFGLYGIYFAFPAADLCSAILSAIIIYYEFKRLNNLKMKSKNL